MVVKITDKKLRILGLYRTNYFAFFHVREIAQCLKINHATLLPHLYALEKEHIMIGTKSGKNKIYTLNRTNILTKHYLLLAEIAKTLALIEKTFFLKKILVEIENLTLPYIFILFGSYAKQTFSEDSDIDIAVLGPITDQQVQALQKTGTLYGKHINIKRAPQFIHALQKKDPLILEIVKDHIILKNAEEFIDILWRHYGSINS